MPRLTRVSSVLASLLIATSGLAATLNVGPSGSGAPYTTIQSAINAAANGDTILVAPGTYYEHVDFGSKAITLLSAGGAANTIIDGSSSGTVLYLGAPDGSPLSATLDGFTIQNGVWSTDPRDPYQGGGVVIVGNALVQNNTIQLNQTCGVDVVIGIATVHNNLIQKNVAAPTASAGGNCRDAGVGIIVDAGASTDPVTISGNVIDGNDSTGISVFQTRGLVSILSNTIRNQVQGGPVPGTGISLSLTAIPSVVSSNLIYNNPGLAIITSIAPGSIITNNTLYNNGTSANQFVQYQASEMELSDNSDIIANNIIYDVGSGQPIYCYVPSIPMQFDHNDVYTPNHTAADTLCSMPNNQYGNRTVDPKFVNLSAGDFHLAAGSPDIDTGNNSAPQVPPIDRDGNPRQQDATGVGYPIYDLGAYENSGTQDANPTTLTLTANYVTVPPGSTVQFNVQAASLNGIPTGSVTFFVDGTAIQTSLLNTTGTATASTATFATSGTHYIVATYPGQGAFTPSISLELTIKATASTTTTSYPTSTTVSGAPNPSTAGQSVTITAHVTSTTSGSGTPTGSITFTYGSTTLASANVDTNGNASITYSTLPVGSDLITATYTPTGSFALSSGTYTQTITGLPQTITFPTLAPGFVATTIDLAATASSGLPVTYKVISGPATISGIHLTFTNPGTVTIEADQAGSSTYASASTQQTVSSTLITSPVASQTITYSTTVVFQAAGTVAAANIYTEGTPSLDFAFGPGAHCIGVTAAVGANCVVTFTFDPTRPGQRHGGIVLTDASGNILANSYIFGLGTGPEVGWLPGVKSLIGANMLQPSGVALNQNNDVFVTLYGGGLVEISATGVQRTIGSFGELSDVIVDGSGNLLIAGPTSVYRVMAVNGVIPATPVIQNLGVIFPQSTTPANNIQLNSIKVDATGNIFLANGTGSLTDGAAYELLAVNGVVPNNPTVVTLGSGFEWLTGVAVDYFGNVYTSDTGAEKVYEMLATNGVVPASVTPTAFNGGTYSNPSNVAVDAANNLFVTDAALGVYELIAVNGAVPFNNPTILQINNGFVSPEGAFIDPNGNLYVADQANGSIIKLDYYGTQQLNFATTAVGATSSDSPRSVTMINNGNAPLTFAIPAPATSNASITPGFTLNSASTCPLITSTTTPAPMLGVAATCTQVVSFTPVVPGTITGQLVATDNSLNAPGTQQIVQLNGTALAPATAVLTANPTTAFALQPVQLTATVSGAFGTPAGTVSFFYNSTNLLGTMTLSGGIAQLTTTQLPVGSDSITCTYSGDTTTYAPANCNTIIETINVLPAALTVTQAPNPVYALSPTTFTIRMTVNGQPAAAGYTIGYGFSGTLPAGASPTGTVTTDSTGTATLTFAPGFHVAGTTVLTVTEAATSTTTSATANLNVNVIPDNTSMTLIASPSPGYQNLPLTLIATVADLTGPAPPAGTVTFTDLSNNTVLGTIVLTLGTSNLSSATLTTSAPPVGTHSIQATYSPTPDFNTGTTATVSETILPSDYTLTADPPSITIQTEHHKSMTLMLTSVGGFTANLALSCDGVVPRWLTCYLPADTYLGPNQAVPVTFTMDTDAVKDFKSDARGSGIDARTTNVRNTIALAILTPFLLLAFRRRRRLFALLIIAAVSVGILSMSACGSKYPDHVAPGTYTVTVLATGVPVTGAQPATGPVPVTPHTLAITLTVTP